MRTRYDSSGPGRAVIFCLAFAFILSSCASPPTNDRSVSPYSDPGSIEHRAARSSVTSGIRSQLDALGSGDFLPVVVRLHNKANLRTVPAVQNATDKTALRQATAMYLRGFAENAQQDVRAAIDSLAAQGLVRNVQPLWVANVICLEATKQAVGQLSRYEEIEYITADVEAPLFLQDTAWGVQHINSPEVWNRAAGDITGRGVVVAVLDSGADLQHPDLVKRFWINSAEDLDGDGRLTRADVNDVDDDNNGYVDDVVGWDFEAGDHDPSPDLFESGRARGHGTHVAGIIAGDGSSGVATGVAPGSELMILKISSQRSAWSAMQYALTNGAHIVNMSFGWPKSLAPDLGTWRDAVDNLTDAGVLVVAAAGSGGLAPMVHSPAPDDITTPGRVPRALTVAAVAPPGRRAWLDPVARFSSAGPVSWQLVGGFSDYPFPPGLMKPDLTAPGVNVTSTMIGGSYAVKSGSSMAVAHVAGAAALLLEHEPDFLPHEVVSRLRETAWRFTDPNDVRGWGRVDALSAIDTPTLAAEFDLEIGDPNQLWHTNSVWVDNDSDGDNDEPIAGMTNRIFARVRNNGGQPVGNAELRFYYAKAGTLGSGGVGRSASGPFNYIGSYFVPVIGPAGSAQDTAVGAVEWQAPNHSDDTTHWSIAVEVVSPDPPNQPETNRDNNMTINNYFSIDVTPGKISTFRFYIHSDPDRPLDPFRLELLRQGLPDEYEVELSLDDVSVSDWSGTIRGFQPIQPVELAEFPADIAYSRNKSMKLLGDRGRLEEIALTEGRPVMARLVIRAPEADSDVYIDRRSASRTLIVNTSNDFGKFGGFTLNFRVDDDAARIDNIIYAQK